MRSVKSISLAALLLVALAGAASAQDFRLSWNHCDLFTINQNFDGPGVYNLVVSVVCLPDISYSAHETWLHLITGPLADAWRFEDSGCQGPSRISYSTAAFSANCPAFEGAAPVRIVRYSALPDCTAEIYLSNSFADFRPMSATRYTLWVISFDHTYSRVGPSIPGVGCGGAEWCAAFVARHRLRIAGTGEVVDFAPGVEDRCGWQGIYCPTLPTTWGRVKALFK